jgi:hypothetical protein
MKKLALAAALLVAAVPAFAAKLTETIDKTFDVRPGAEVKLTNVNGSITVTAWDQPRVRVVAQKEVKGDRHDAEQAMKELTIEFRQQGGGLVVNTKYPDLGSSIFDWLTGDHVNANVRYELTVPRTMNLDLSDTNGSIRVTDVSGRLELDTTNGRIEAMRCAGSLDASTTNGGIDAELLRVTPGQPISLATTNGRIELALPHTFAGEVDAATTNGAISTDLPVAATRVGDNRLKGTINGGGTALKLRTTNGGIEISKSSF